MQAQELPVLLPFFTKVLPRGRFHVALPLAFAGGMHNNCGGARRSPPGPLLPREIPSRVARRLRALQ